MRDDNAQGSLAVHDAVVSACNYSRYLARLLTATPTLFDEIDFTRPCQVPPPDQQYANRDALHTVLRRLRRRTMATLIVRDLAGWAPLSEVMQAMTALARITLDAALSWICADVATVYGAPVGVNGEPMPLLVIGMGKLGGEELNVSSDIDLVFVYPAEGETPGPRVLSHHEYFTRVGRQLIAALAEVTGDGFVFRVDMRLRPYGDSGPLVVNFDMLENYFITQGREWERYAWVKARALSGAAVVDSAASATVADELMKLVRPFVYRRHLDFSAIASMRELHAQIRVEVNRREREHNIKLGRGGIREIEFIAQAFQLIRGGHDAALRERATLPVLALLAERGQLPRQAVAELTQAYDFLRRLEHRLQYRDDQQTHDIPADAETRTALAATMGYSDFDALSQALEQHRHNVSRQFDALFSDAHHQRRAPERDVGSLKALSEMGFTNADALHARLTQMRNTERYRQMPATGQARLDRLLPVVTEASAQGGNPDATLERMLTFLESISRRESYLALLEEYPQTCRRLADLMRASPWVAQYLTQHPILLDELLEARTLHEPPDWQALARQIRTALDQTENDTERQMDTLRHFKHAQTLHLIAQDLAGMLSLEAVSDHLSELACATLAETVRLAWAGMRMRHRDTPAFAVIAYGKLGGKELGYASDLDLVFVHDDPAEQAPENYARLAQRILTWLTSTTTAGQLYDTDMRLRPDGQSGLLVSPFDGYEHYQLKRAWTWEHQALTRARFVAGDAAMGARFEALREHLLRMPRDLTQLRGEVLTMREKMHAAHPNNSGQFDVKHDPGGIVDVEFIVQYLVWGYAQQHAGLTGNIGNLALLKLAARLALIPGDIADAAHAAYRAYRTVQHKLRLNDERYSRTPKAELVTEAAAVCALWRAVFDVERMR